MNHRTAGSQHRELPGESHQQPQQEPQLKPDFLFSNN